MESCLHLPPVSLVLLHSPPSHHHVLHYEEDDPQSVVGRQLVAGEVEHCLECDPQPWVVWECLGQHPPQPWGQ